MVKSELRLPKELIDDFNLPGGKDALGRFVAKLFECREEATELFSVGVSHRSKVILEAFDGVSHRSKMISEAFDGVAHRSKMILEAFDGVSHRSKMISEAFDGVSHRSKVISEAFDGVSHRSKVILEAFDGIFHRSKRFWRLGKCSPDVGKDFRSLENEF